MPELDIEATREAARRVRGAGEDVEGVGRTARLTDCAGELQGSRTLIALDGLAEVLDGRMVLVRGELHTVATGMGDLAERTARAVGEGA